MFFNSITIFTTFLLLLLVPFARAADADCRMMTPGENPNLDDAEALLGKIFAVCHVDPPRLPAMSTYCYPWTYRTAEIRICPPKTLDRHLWSTPVSYDCPSLLATIGSIIEKCRTVVSTGGRMNLEHAQYGYIILTRPGGPN
ncbi:hypothetical protein DFP73DRAFT_592891 [Morchella snyderi]|nr:hypothetical protein DFP73DRAFT_592891 [Morchella snyderi]